ncbi:hypothetical protein BDK51DRAFT_9156, partial [Blyttiomyces helicus]
GDWFPGWAQQPTFYRQTWIRLVTSIRAGGLNTAMVFSPSAGFTPVRNPPASGTPDFILFDTNNDGVLDQNDDPYAPYYAGDEYVDWVGLS